MKEVRVMLARIARVSPVYLGWEGKAHAQDQCAL